MFPSIFVGHGSPMNVLDDNIYTQAFRKFGEDHPSPTAILCVSAHWVTRGTEVVTVDQPKQIFDFHGFPEELYKVTYTPPGAPQIATDLAANVPSVQGSTAWGLDHGAWSVLHHMYPRQNVPTFQLSLNANLSLRDHLALAREIGRLRNQGVLIIGSGNIVHNLRAIKWQADASAHSWAIEFEEMVVQTVLDMSLTADQKVAKVFNSPLVSTAHPSLEHLMPLVYALGATAYKDDSKEHAVNSSPIAPLLLVRGIQNASVSMASFAF